MMSPPLALLTVAGVAIISNRIFAILLGLVFRVPATWLLPTVILLDLAQIPLFYWLYENSGKVLARLPARIRPWLNRDWNAGRLGRWTASLGGLGVFLIAALPTFGGGMWSAVFLAYGLRLKKAVSYGLIALGSIASYLVLFYVLDTLVRTVRYFWS
jgi:hypothetical protein